MQTDGQEGESISIGLLMNTVAISRSGKRERALLDAWKNLGPTVATTESNATRLLTGKSLPCTELLDFYCACPSAKTD